jgi:hypothetical protein
MREAGGRRIGIAMNESTMNETGFDRALEDVGNVVAFEHVNTRVPDQQLATLFYVSGLGLTRDPYLMTGTDNMWINAGRTQFHLPTGDPQVVRGVTQLVVPDLRALAARLERVRGPLSGTRFEVRELDDAIEVTSPWGNVIRCRAPDTTARFALGIAAVEFDVEIGSARGIAAFYREVLGALAHTTTDGTHESAHIAVGVGQQLVFRERPAPLRKYDGHHIQVYIADFSGPHRHLRERKLVTEESSPHQYRFEDIVEPSSGRVLFKLEHEIRSLRHPLYARPLVNRNPAQTNTQYMPGRDAL